ncbi:MAG: malectin domain-containing carbohydrate-binding protein, partial [Victivallales bacterium]
KTKPAKDKKPVFDVGEAVLFEAAIPVGLKAKCAVKASVCYDESKEVIENSGPVSSEDADGLTKFLFKLDAPQVGPYVVKWEVLDAQGSKRAEAEDEFVVVGPIAQDEYGLAEFEKELDKRLKLVRKIDCTADIEIGDEFLGHTGMYNKPALKPGTVVSRDGMRYRETGDLTYDYYAYRLHLKELGKPYLVEVVVPDNGNRQIYSGVEEQYPVLFENNGISKNSLAARMPATGACKTGGMYPVSNSPKKLRYVYWPNSLTAAVIVMKGADPDPAAAIEINIYKIENDLPALKVPPSNRRFGSYEERSLMPESMAAENILEKSDRLRAGDHFRKWRNWYKMAERKIKWLRFQGRNLAVEGAYMYTKGDFPSVKHSSYFTSNTEDNLLDLSLRMYQRNNIKCLLGLSYMGSPWIAASGIDDLSDRKMVAEKKESLHLVDRYGDQMGVGNGMNFLHPAMRGIFMDLVGELYAGYKGIDCVEGLFLVTTDWWAPGFINIGRQDLECSEVGYGDLTVRLFEKESGISLGISPDDPERFGKRYAVLTGKYQEAWFKWREQKLSDMFREISGVIGKGDNKWKLYVHPEAVAGGVLNQKKMYLSSGKATRDAFFADALRDNALDPALTQNDKMIRFVCPMMNYNDIRFDESKKIAAVEWNTSKSVLGFVKNNSCYFIQSGLQEYDCPASAAKRWICSGTKRCAFDQKGVGDNCMAPYVEIIKSFTPELIIKTWLDCNMETAHGEQIRRFCKAFYATPELDFNALPSDSVRGVFAQTAENKKGEIFLRLVNDTPYASSGHIEYDGKAYDCVYDKEIEQQKGGFPINLLPNDIRIVRLMGKMKEVRCDFSFAPDIMEKVKREAAGILAYERLKKIIPSDTLAALTGALRAADGYAIFSILNTFDMRMARKEGTLMEMQALLLADLNATGHAFIDCAGNTVFTDAKGNRWLPDQPYFGTNAYGNTGASIADRGTDLSIENTDAPRMHQTEAYGEKVIYRIPAPNGTYHVHLHFAETYTNIQSAGKRSITVTVNGHRWEKRVDPFADAGGFAKAVVLSEKNLDVQNGMITVELENGVGINGIEIERADMTPGSATRSVTRELQWQFADGQFADAAGNKITAQLSGGAAPASFKDIGMVAIPLKGMISAPRDAGRTSLALGKDNITLSAMLKITGNKGQAYVICNGAGSYLDPGYRFGANVADGKINFYLLLVGKAFGPNKYNSVQVSIDADKRPNTGDWLHVSAVINRVGEAAIYLNGKIAGKGSVAALAQENIVNEGNFLSGVMTSEGQPPSAMSVAAISVWRGMLSSVEIQQDSERWMEAVKE